MKGALALAAIDHPCSIWLIAEQRTSPIVFLLSQHGFEARGMDVADSHGYGVGRVIGLGDEIEAQ